MATQCDLLVAVWDGKAAHGVGGTGELVEHAQFVGLPILHIDSEAPGRLQFLDRDGKHANALVALEGSIRSLFIQSVQSTERDSAESRGTRGLTQRPSWLMRLIALSKPPADTTLGFAKDYMRAQWPRSIDPSADAVAVV